jgi:hypothetical protein
LYERWRRKGLAHERAREFEHAIPHYRRMRELMPERARGWYGEAQSLLETGDPGKAVEVIDEARTRMQGVPLDFVEIEIYAAVACDQSSLAKRRLLELGNESQTLARSLVSDLDLSDLASDSELQFLSVEDSEDAGLKGYA